jgi:hypothetical protein
VRRPASTKLTSIGSALESRISSPSENAASCKSSPTRCSSDGQIGCATPPHQMRPPNGNAVTQTRSAARAGILVPQTQDSLRRRAVTKPSHSHMQTHDASSSRNRERRSIQAFTLCGDDVSSSPTSLPQLVTKRPEQVTMHSASGYPIVRFAWSVHAGDRVELGTERSVPVYGMNRRSRDHESQPGTQTCKSIGDPVHGATLTLRERQIPRVKQSASYELTTCGKRIASTSATCIVSTESSGSSHGCCAHGRRMIPAPDASLRSQRHDLSHTCIPNIVHTMTPHFLQRGYDAKALVAA